MESRLNSIIHFIRSVYRKPEGFIPLHAPVFRGNEKKYLEECIDTTYVSSVGRFVDRFEEGIAKFTGANSAVSCVNGTNALHLALQLVGVDRDSEVITQPLTFVATANAISYCGAKPVFLDVDLDTLGLSPNSLVEWLEQNVSPVKNDQPPINRTTGKRIAACVPMHTFGHPCRIDQIVEICNRYNIPVVEDAAESLGSFYKGKHTGTFGRVGVISFNGNKVITTGGGGMLLFSDKELAARAKHLTTQAKVPHPWEFNHDAIGYNYRMPNINAALGLAQLEQLPEFLEQKRQIAEKYRQFFANTAPAVEFFSEPAGSKANFWLNAILFNSRGERNQFLEFSNSMGVMTRPVWTLITELPMFKDTIRGNLKNAFSIEERLVNIPSSPF